MKDDIELLDVNMDEEDRRKSSAKKKPVINISVKGVRKTDTLWAS